MMRPVAILKVLPLLPAATALASSLGTMTGGAVTSGAVAGAATGAATGAVSTGVGAGIGSALMQGAKKKIGQVGVMDAASIAQNASDKATERAQQSQQNNIQSSQDLADKAKEKADLTKAWRFDSRLQKPEYADFTDKLIEAAKQNTVSPNEHYKKRMGEAGNPNEHRYQGRQPFIHNDEEVDVSPHQIASAFMDHLHTDKSFTDKNHPEDTVHSLQDMFETDTPHHDPYWENRGDEMRRGEDGKMIISNLSPQMIGNPTTGYQSKTATPVQSEYGRHMNRINPIDYATQNEVHYLPQESNQPKRPSAQVRVRNAVADSKHRVANLSPQQFADRKHAEMFGNRNSIGPYGTKVPQPTGDSDREIFDQRQGWLQNWYNASQQTDEPQKETGSTHRLSPDYNPNLVKPQQAEPETETEGEPDYQPSPIPGMVYLNGKLIADPRNIGTGEPMDIAMRLLKESVHLTHNEDLPHQFSQDIANLDNRHEIAPTKTGSEINNIHPNMLRTIQLMAENYQDNTPVQEEVYEPPTYF